MAVDRQCSNCGNKGHNSRTCTFKKKTTFMLFGVKIEQPNFEEHKNPYTIKGTHKSIYFSQHQKSLKCAMISLMSHVFFGEFRCAVDSGGARGVPTRFKGFRTR